MARDAGLELGYANAIKVDEHMRTNILDIFAAGDRSTARNYITNNDTYLPLGTTANKARASCRRKRRWRKRKIPRNSWKC
jgi:pyruvate/2-oxoglutarate dehydrogenase complex dihydrolipoamide dehydrogenase (E3) component